MRNQEFLINNCDLLTCICQKCVFAVDHHSFTIICHQPTLGWYIHCRVRVTAADVGEEKPNVFYQVKKEKK